MQPDNIGRPSACRFQRGEALISSCSDQGHGHHRQRHVRVKAKLDPKPVKLHWCCTVSRWPRASEEDAASGLRQSRSSRARFSAGRHGSARGCPGNATARSPSASPTPYRGLDRQRSQARRTQQCPVTRLAGARPDRAHAVHPTMAVGSRLAPAQPRGPEQGRGKQFLAPRRVLPPAGRDPRSHLREPPRRALNGRNRSQRCSSAACRRRVCSDARASLMQLAETSICSATNDVSAAGGRSLAWRWRPG